jgi:hypothetical protein
MRFPFREPYLLAILLALQGCGGPPASTPVEIATQMPSPTLTRPAPTVEEGGITTTPADTAAPAPTVPDTPAPPPTKGTPLPATTPAEISTPLTLERIGQLGGLSNAVAVQDHYAYLNVGPRLVVLDIANPAQPVEVGRSSPLSGFEDLVVAGDHAYVAAGEGGLLVMDVSDPSAPNQVNVYPTSAPAWSIATGGNTAYLGAGDGLHILDISDPVAPAPTGFHGTPDAVYDVSVAGDIAYLAEAFSPGDNRDERGGLRLLDISDPASPDEMGYYPMNPLQADEFQAPGEPRGAYNVAVAGERAYLTYRTERQGGLRVVDVSDPAQPVEIGDYQGYLYYVSDVAVVEGPSTDAEQTYAYLATGVNMGLLLLDVSDPAQPEVLADDVPGWARHLAVAGDTLLVADEAGGLQIADISDPAHPTWAGSYNTLGNARGVMVSGDRAYVTDGLRALWVVDVSDPAQPTQAGVLTTVGSIFDVAEAGSLVYVAAETEGLLLVDVSDPAHPIQIGTYDTPGLAYGVDIVGDHVYVADGQLQVLDVTDPAAPAPAASYEGSARVEDVLIAGDAAYLTDGGLEILDVSDPARPVSLGGYATPGGIADAVVVGNHAYLVVKGDLLILDISNPAEPFELSRLDLDGMPEYGGHLAVAEGVAYVGGGQRLHVVDVSDPANPREITSYDELHSANGIAAAGGNVFVADGLYGLVVLQWSNPPQSGDLPPATQTAGLPDGEIRNLWIAPDGSLWVATEAGVFVDADGEWIQVLDGPVERLLGADNAGRIWALLDSGAAIASYDATGSWRTYGPEQGWTALPPHQYLSPGYGDGLVTDERGRVWWATGQDDLRRLDGHSQTWSTFRATDLGFESPEDEDYQGHFLTDVELLESQVWVGDCVGMGEAYSGQGIHWTDGEAWFDVPFTAGQCVLDIEADDAGRIWVGGFDAIHQYDPATESWLSFSLPDWERRQLVVEIDLDEEGNPWVEVLRYGGASPFGEVGHYHLHDGEWVMDFEGWFSSLAFGADGAAWACSEGSIIQLQSGLAKEVDTVPGTECQVVVDGVGRVWITNHDGLWWLEPES